MLVCIACTSASSASAMMSFQPLAPPAGASIPQLCSHACTVRPHCLQASSIPGPGASRLQVWPYNNLSGWICGNSLYLPGLHNGSTHQAGPQYGTCSRNQQQPLAYTTNVSTFWTHTITSCHNGVISQIMVTFSSYSCYTCMSLCFKCGSSAAPTDHLQRTPCIPSGQHSLPYEVPRFQRVFDRRIQGVIFSLVYVGLAAQFLWGPCKSYYAAAAVCVAARVEREALRPLTVVPQNHMAVVMHDDALNCGVCAA